MNVPVNLRSLPLLALLPLLPLLGACDPGEPAVQDEPAAEGREWAPDEGIQLSAGTDRALYRPGDTIRVVLRVANRLEVERTLSFPTAQRYDLRIVTAEGDEVYHWGADQAFAQVLGEERLGPGERGPEWSEWIPAPSEPGEYRIRALVPVNGIELRAELPIEVAPA